MISICCEDMLDELRNGNIRVVYDSCKSDNILTVRNSVSPLKVCPYCGAKVGIITENNPPKSWVRCTSSRVNTVAKLIGDASEVLRGWESDNDTLSGTSGMSARSVRKLVSKLDSLKAEIMEMRK